MLGLPISPIGEPDRRKMDRSSFRKSKLYRHLVRSRHSQLLRRAAALARLPEQLVRTRRNNPFFAVDIRARMGMGAVVSHAIVLIHHAEAHGLLPRISSTNPLFSRGGRDFISEYLGPGGTIAEAHLRPLRFDNLESVFHLRLAHHLPIVQANRIFWTYLHPKPVVTDRAETLLHDLGISQFDLSIHYRGTDKVLEGALVAYEDVEQAVTRHVDDGGRLDVVFLATDDVRFDRFVRSRWPKTLFVSFTLGRPDPSVPRHFSDMPPEDKAIEALVNILLIARAPKCVRTTSYMSAISKIANPSLLTKTLSRTYADSRLFPEHEVLASEG